MNFTSGSIKALKPQWYGAIGDGSTTATSLAANNAAFLACVKDANDSVKKVGGIAIELSGLFYISANLILNSGIAIFGFNRASDGFILGPGMGDFITLGSITNHGQLNTVRNFCMIGQNSTYDHGVVLANEYMATLKDLVIQIVGADSAIQVISANGHNSGAFRIERCDIQYGNHGIRFTGGGGNNAQAFCISHNRIQNNDGVGIYASDNLPVSGTIDANDLEGNNGGAIDILYSSGLTVTNNYGEQVYTQNYAPYRFGSCAYNGLSGVGGTSSLRCEGNGGSNSNAKYIFDFGYDNYAQCTDSIIKGNGMAFSTDAGMAFGIALNCEIGPNYFNNCGNRYLIRQGCSMITDLQSGKKGIILNNNGNDLLTLGVNGSIGGFFTNPIETWSTSYAPSFKKGQVVPNSSGTVGDPAFFVCIEAGKLHFSAQKINTTLNSNSISFVGGNGYSWYENDPIKGTGLPLGTTITAWTNWPTTCTVSQNATATNSNVPGYDAVFVPSGQIGFRTGSASPSGSVTPKFVGEVYLDINNHVTYRAYGKTSADWY